MEVMYPPLRLVYQGPSNAERLHGCRR